MSRAGAAGMMMLWTPLALGSKLKLWLRADRGVTLTSGAVSTWADQSGNGFDFTQSTSGKRPTVSSIGGRASILFDGTDDALTNAGNLSSLINTTTGALHWYFDLYTTSVHSGSTAGIGTAAANVHAFTSQPGYAGVGFQNVGGTSTTYKAINWTYQSTVGYNGTESSYLLNQRNVISAKVTGGGSGETRLNNDSPIADASWGGIGVGGGPIKLGENYIGTRWYAGHMHEIIICNAAMSAGEEASARAYLGLAA